MAAVAKASVKSCLCGCRAMLCISAAYAVTRFAFCLSAWLSCVVCMSRSCIRNVSRCGRCCYMACEYETVPKLFEW